MNFTGIITALITPFYQGKIDKSSFLKLIRQQLDEGCDGLVINGTTGEAPTLKEDEIAQLMEWATAEVSRKVPIILGVGHNSTEQAVINIQKAHLLKATAVLAVSPYYNKPSQEGLLKHFKKLANTSELPILLYNVPSRTQVQLEVETIKTLSQEKNIVGIKEASGDMAFVEKLLSSQLPETFVVSSGDDASFLELTQKGGHGVISVSSHFMLKQMKHYLKRTLQKETLAVTEFQEKYESVIEMLFTVSNPMMVKQVMFFKNIIRSPELRLPLCEPPSHLVQKMKQLLQTAELL